jgi:hypothetical protein
MGERSIKRITEPQNYFYLFALHRLPRDLKPIGPSNMIKVSPLEMDSIQWRPYA